MYSEVVIFKFLLRKRISITDYQTLKITVYQINGLLESDKLVKKMIKNLPNISTD